MNIEDESGVVIGECVPGRVCPECAMRLAEIERLKDENRKLVEEILELKGFDEIRGVCR